MILACRHCGQKNRLTAGNLTVHVRCGNCKQAIAPVAHPIDADAQTFDEVLREACVPVLVDFWAAWCAPCRMTAPEVTKVAEETAGCAVVLKVDTDRFPEVAERYGVRGIPNFVVLRDGRVVFQESGAVSHTEMLRWLQGA
jgi:thioredoxin 2